MLSQGSPEASSHVCYVIYCSCNVCNFLSAILSHDKVEQENKITGVISVLAETCTHTDSDINGKAGVVLFAGKNV